MEQLKKRLRKRGWKESEIKKIEEVLSRAETTKSPAMKIADRFMFWVFFIIITFGNFLLALSLIPILIYFNEGIVYLLLSIIAVLFGVVFNVLIHSFEFSKKKQHISLIGTVIFSVIFILIVNNYAEHLSKFVYHYRNPIFIVLAYLTAFITPYFVFKTIVYKREHAIH